MGFHCVARKGSRVDRGTLVKDEINDFSNLLGPWSWHNRMHYLTAHMFPSGLPVPLPLLGNLGYETLRNQAMIGTPVMPGWSQKLAWIFRSPSQAQRAC